MLIISQYRSKLVIVILLTSLYMVVEIIGSILTNSLALVTDAIHMFSHVGALIMAFLAITFATKPPTPEKSFGYYRLEVLATLFNSIILTLLVLYIFYQAYQRLLSPQDVLGSLMIIIASIGLVINLIGAKLLHHSSKESLIFRSAFLAVITDTLGSVGVITAGIVIFLTRWYIVDPILSALIGLIIIPNIYKLIKASVNVLMESTPEHISPKKVEETLLSIEGVTGVHHLHIWTITSGVYAISAHLTINKPEGWDNIREQAMKVLKEKFKMAHSTVQIEDEETHRKLHVKKE
ncbi:MAG: cation diffusion facilitator family transporter [Nitrososphaerales archaeon]